MKEHEYNLLEMVMPISYSHDLFKMTCCIFIEENMIIAGMD
jgi:hypothetical protein